MTSFLHPQALSTKSKKPHDWGVNVSFDDGHSAWTKLPDLWQLTWNRIWVPHGQPQPALQPPQ